MRRTLINSTGKSFESRTIDSTSKQEQKFLWKQNFKNIETQKVKSEKKVFKINARKSKAANVQKQIWSKTSLKLQLAQNKFINTFENSLISKGILVIDVKNDEATKVIKTEKAQAILEQQAKIFEQRIDEIKIISKEAVENKLSGSKELFKEKMNEANTVINSFKGNNDFIIKGLKSLTSKEIPSKGVNFTLIKSAKKEIKSVNKRANKLSREFATLQTKRIEAMPNLSRMDKLNINIKKTAKKFKKADGALATLKTHSEKTFDFELMYKNALVMQESEKEILEIKKKFAKEINDLSLTLVNIKSKKEHIKKEQEAFKILLDRIKSDWKTSWKTKKNTMKAGSASRRAKKVASKEAKNELHSTIRVAKLNNLSVFKAKNDLSKKRIEFRDVVKYNNKIRETKLKDNLKNTPIEITTFRYWTSIILGSLFPGLDALINKQWVKAFLQMIATTVVILLLAYSFGAFKSSSGQGIVGLSALGDDPKTATNIAFGMTGGKPHDGRFFLVMGVVGVIFLAVGIFYWIISILNNINQNNLARIGVRYSNWKKQKQLLKSEGLPYLLSIPAMIFILFIVLLPLLATVLISFTNLNQKTWSPEDQMNYIADGVTTPIKWVGTKQYDLIFKVMGPEFKDVFVWTIIWTLGSTMTLLVIGTLMAIVVNQNRIKGKTFFRVIYLLPWAVPAFITIMFFSLFFQHAGRFNEVIGNKIFAPDTNWLQAGSKTKVLMIMLQGWLGHSYIFLLITGMLQSIPKSLYEAARIDGSSSIRQFRTITLPIVMTQIAPLIIGQFTFNFNNFGLIYLLNEGGTIEAGKTAGEQDIFISWIYKLINSGTNPRPGAAAAMSLVIAVFTVTPSAFMFARSNSFRKADF